MKNGKNSSAKHATRPTSITGSPAEQGRPTLYLTPGEPAGIGPELAVKAAANHTGLPLVLVADRDLVSDTAQRLQIDIRLQDHDPAQAGPQQPGALQIIHCPIKTRAVPGQLDPANSQYVLNTLQVAARRCLDNPGSALVTGPVHKAVINAAGMAFTGHTEYLAEQSGGVDVIMMLASDLLRVALVTTHLSLREVPDAITLRSVATAINVVDRALRQRFAIPRPVIHVCGLNPHAGEGGHLGREEIDVIAPAIESCRASGISVTGPLPADSAFTHSNIGHCDAIIAMYHDQGLPVLKHASFGTAVNITLGLPFVRTSVDHGTALDISGRGSADPGSLLAAIKMAAQLAG